MKKSKQRVYNLNVWKVGYYKGWRWFWWNIKNFFKTFKYAFQRATRGYSDYDVWNADCYLASLISTLVRRLNETKTSYPASLYKDGKSDEQASKEWSAILDEISECFEKYGYYFDYDDFNDYDETAVDRGLDLLKKYFRSLWD